MVVLHLAGRHPQASRGLWAMEEELDPALTEGIEAYHVFSGGPRLRRVSYVAYLWSAIGAYRRVRANGFRPDIVHAHVYSAGVPAAIFATRSGISFVLTEHSSGVAQRSLNRLEARKAHYAYTRAARVLPVSRFLEDSIRNYASAAAFEIVPNVVDNSVFFPRRTRRSEAEPRRLLFVGNLEPLQLKGFPTLLRALALLRQRGRDWKLDVIGDGLDRRRSERLAVDLGLRDRVTFHGSCSKLVIAEMMREADLLVQPSRMETFGAVVAEALVSGLPVVSTTVGGIPELVDECSGRLVPPDDSVGLADAIDDMLKNVGTFDRRGIAARASGRYSLDVVGARLTGIYKAVLTEAVSEHASRAAAL